MRSRFMRLAPALIGLFCGSGLAAAGAQEPEPAARAEADGTSRAVPLETDLPAALRERVAPPIELPPERDAEFYTQALGGVLAAVGGEDVRAAIEGWLSDDVHSLVPPEPVAPEQLRRDAARLARVRLRRTADERQARREPFDAFGDLLERVDHYEGRPFTVWGHIRELKPLPAPPADAGAPHPAVLYEARLEPIAEAARPVVLLLTAVPDGFPAGAEVHEAASVTGYVFRAEPADAERGAEPWRPLLVAPAFTWHQAELASEARAALAGAIRHRTPHRLEEVDSFYGLVRHAELVDYGRQQEVARRFRQQRIERFPADSRADLEHRLHEIAAEREARPRDEAALERREQQARSLFAHERRQYAAFRDDPEQFPLFAHLFRSVESSDPHRYTGRPVTLAGHVRKHVSYPADPENEHGVAWLHEVWLYPDDADSNPVVIVCTSAPGLPEGEALLERATVTGYFYKLWAYPARDTTRVAPMLLAQRVEWLPRAEAADLPPWLTRGVWLAGGLLAALIVWSAWNASRRGRRRPERVAHRTDDEPPDFSRLA